MATIFQDIKQNAREAIRDRFEENTGIIGQTLRARREKAEHAKAVQKQVDVIHKQTTRIKHTGSTLTSIEISFTQMSENLQLVAKALKAQSTTLEETRAGMAAESTKPQQQPAENNAVRKLANDTEEESLFDKISNLLDDLDPRKRKIPRGGKAPTKAPNKGLQKIEEKATNAKTAAEKAARAAGKSEKAVQQAGRAAAKQIVKRASAEAVKAATRKVLLRSLGKLAAKSIPFVGIAAGLGFAVSRVMQGDLVGAGIEVASGVAGPITSIPLTVVQVARDVYIETYGVPPDQDDSPDKDERYKEVYRIVREEVEAAVKEALIPSGPAAPTGMEFDAEGNVQAAPKQPTRVGPAPSVSVTPQTPETKIRATAKANVSTIDMGQLQPSGGIVGTVMESLKSAGIASEKAIGNILATIKAESGFRPRSESLNFTSAEAIQKTFGKNRVPTLEFAQQFVGKPEALANEMYKKSDGNRDPGDGWKYRGRGFIQHTGRNQYEGIKKFTGVDVVSNPDLLNDPVLAAKAVAWFFLSYKKKTPQQLENMSEVNTAVGFADDKAGTKAAQRVESATQINASFSTGKDMESLSTSVASAKKDKQKSGGNVTVVAINNTTKQESRAAPSRPSSQTVATVGA